MRSAVAITVTLILALFIGQRAAQTGDFEKHMKKYDKHMKEAREEFREGDWDDAYEELGKANREYNKAMRAAPPEWYSYESPGSCIWSCPPRFRYDVRYHHSGAYRYHRAPGYWW